ncbi:hypothetical protein JHD48_05715 [Sulfurimonas sp. SAG-AH-194-I05]|nr:hypothetical protein [Sulfurimonas sp. SAG-AH-194-I05]MDF1875222.1 hypothetical protein [Sulfurimonas sp. SAG-AH-194-I05]
MNYSYFEFSVQLCVQLKVEYRLISYNMARYRPARLHQKNITLSLLEVILDKITF